MEDVNGGMTMSGYKRTLQRGSEQGCDNFRLLTTIINESGTLVFGGGVETAAAALEKASGSNGDEEGIGINSSSWSG